MDHSNQAKRLIQRLSALVVTIGASQMIILSQISLISEYCALSVAELGMLIALGTACIMVAGPFWGRAVDRHGARPILVLGLLSTLVANLAFVSVILLLGLNILAPKLGLVILALSRVVHGTGAAGIYPACQSWGVSHSPAQQRIRVLSSLSAAVNIGRVLGPVLALPTLALLSLWQQADPAWQLSTLLWILVLPLFGLWALSGLKGTAQAVAERGGAPADAGRPTPYLLFALAICCTITVSQLQVLLGPVLEDHYGFSALAASKGSAALLVLIALLAATMQLTVVRRLQHPRLGLGAGGASLLVGVVALQLGLGSWLALAGLMLMVAGVTLMIPSYTSLLSAAAGSRQGRIFGQLSMVHTAGFTVGFGLGSWLYTHVALSPLLGVLGSSTLLLTALAFSLCRRPANSQDDALSAPRSAR